MAFTSQTRTLTNSHSWNEDLYSRYHSPDDDVHRAFRVSVARLLTIPLTTTGARCCGCQGGLDAHADHALTCKTGTGWCMGSWKTMRHDALIGILFRLGVASGLRKGDHIQPEVRDLFTAKGPSDILVRRPREERAAGEEAAFRFKHDVGGVGCPLT